MNKILLEVQRLDKIVTRGLKHKIGSRTHQTNTFHMQILFVCVCKCTIYNVSVRRALITFLLAVRLVNKMSAETGAFKRSQKAQALNHPNLNYNQACILSVCTKQALFHEL